jgi:hypothetical protein
MNILAGAHLDKLIGAMIFQKPSSDNNNIRPIKALNLSLLKKINNPDFEPSKKVNLRLILIKYKELPSSITL